jgi:hypothetical protein
MSESEGLVENLISDLVALEERLDAVEDELQQLNDLRERVERLEDRTDMLRFIEEAGQTSADQRRAALWQHCARMARGNGGTYVIDRDGVEEALHRPDVHRTTLYEDMRSVADNTAREEIARYVPARDAETNQAELRIDLTGVSESVDASTLYEGGE